MTDIAFDIHTHRYRPNDPCVQVLNIRLLPDSTILDFPPHSGNLILSAGVHPWDTEAFVPKGALNEAIKLIFSNDRVKYIGEIGLDKLRGAPICQQLALFRMQLSIANRLHKPVILHCVKAMEEILAVKKDYPDIPEWIVHGFRGKKQQALQWLDHGFNLSFGLKYDAESFSLCPQDRRYRETDE